MASGPESAGPFTELAGKYGPAVWDTLADNLRATCAGTGCFCAAPQRARASATMQFGALIGPAAGALPGGFLILRHGWRAMCVVMGAASLLWRFGRLAIAPVRAELARALGSRERPHF